MKNSDTQKGCLYVVATPIGNLEDVTYRAVRTLKEVSLIVAEDTRHARKLLSHYEIKARCEHYDDRLHENRKRVYLDYCHRGESIALLSDAGTPVISDPGWSLVDMAWRDDIRVIPIPGPSAPIAALSASGFPISHFVFWGFLPRTPGKRKRAVESVNEWQCVVFFESPHRILKTLEEIAAMAIEGLQVCVARELTKIFEECVRGTPADILEYYKAHPIKGEFCIILWKK